jgi:hypothetical protein
MHDRLQKRQFELEEAAVRRFDERCEDFAGFVRNFGRIAGQLEIDFPE